MVDVKFENEKINELCNEVVTCKNIKIFNEEAFNDFVSKIYEIGFDDGLLEGAEEDKKYNNKKIKLKIMENLVFANKNLETLFYEFQKMKVTTLEDFKKILSELIHKAYEIGLDEGIKDTIEYDIQNYVENYTLEHQKENSFNKEETKNQNIVSTTDPYNYKEDLKHASYFTENGNPWRANNGDDIISLREKVEDGGDNEAQAPTSFKEE